MRGLPLILCCVPLPLMAQTLGLPQGCTGFLTTQRANCTVINYYTCSSDPADWRRAVLAYGDGLDTFFVSDTEGQWIETVNTFTGVTDRLVDGAPDPVSFSTLMDTGLDLFDFQIATPDSQVTHIVGTDKLTGERVVIDGEELIVVSSEIRAEDATGGLVWSYVGSDHILPDYGIMIGGVTSWIMPEDNFTADTRPVSIVRPGEPGFFSATPEFGCT